jgi:hypothetical protein
MRAPATSTRSGTMLFEMVTGQWPFEATLSVMVTRVVTLCGRAPDGEQVQQMMRAVLEEKVTNDLPSHASASTSAT